MQSNLLVQTTAADMKIIDSLAGKARFSTPRRFALAALLTLLLSSIANHALAGWLGLSQRAPWSHAQAAYRRIGPQTGPQVFCAGSSLLVSGLSWPEVSKSLGLGIENWTVAGSSPEVWEVFQQHKRVSNTTIIGVSVYDLNEMRLTPERASYVPLSTSVADLWSSQAGADLRHRILAQYAMSYVRVLYPMAGDADKVLVALRTKAAGLLHEEGSLEQHEGVVVEKDGVLDVEDEMTTLSDWSSARVLRRLEALRAENHGIHSFIGGPKSQAFRRLLLRAQEQGHVIVAVLPVSPYYSDALLDKTSMAAFEEALRYDMAATPAATLVRLDQVTGITSNRYFFDLVHLNSSGRQMLTQVFLKEVNEGSSTAKPQPWLAMDFASANPRIIHTACSR